MCDPESQEETLTHGELEQPVTVFKSVARVLKKNGWTCVEHDADADPPAPEPAARNYADPAATSRTYADRTKKAAAARAAKNEENN